MRHAFKSAGPILSYLLDQIGLDKLIRARLFVPLPPPSPPQPLFLTRLFRRLAIFSIGKSSVY
jgi:hypothetical protein